MTSTCSSERRPRLSKILVEPDELHLVPPDPDAEPEPAAGQDVETRSLLGDEHGLTLRQDQDLGGEIGDVSASGKETEQDERVVIPVGRSGAPLGPIGPASDIDAEHVIGGCDTVIADLLCGKGKIPQSPWLTTDIDDRKGYTEFHLHLLCQIRQCSGGGCAGAGTEM
jgi:hypothetical protein